MQLAESVLRPATPNV